MAGKNERKNLRGRAGRMQGGRGSGRSAQGYVRLWGRHAVEAALKNPERRHRKLWARAKASPRSMANCRWTSRSNTRMSRILRG